MRAFHVADATKENVAAIIRKNVATESRLHTDESRIYHGAEAHVRQHETVKHAAGEYARGDVTTNSVEGFFKIFKTGVAGIYGHCSEKYLSMYLAEYAHRYTHRQKLGVHDKERAARAIKGAIGKRLTLRQPQSQATAT